MYIMADLSGKLIQLSNQKINNLKEKTNELSQVWGRTLLYTESEELYNKAITTGHFHIIVKNNMIVDIIPKEKPINLDKLKAEKTMQTKQQLAEFLEAHTLLYSGENYSVTQEKQALLTSAIAAYQLKVQSDIPAVLKWNTTGDICREFNLEEITGLVIAITDYVQPRVEKQQELEIQIKNCTTIEELDSIIINYEVV